MQRVYRNVENIYFFFFDVFCVYFCSSLSSVDVRSLPLTDYLAHVASRLCVWAGGEALKQNFTCYTLHVDFELGKTRRGMILSGIFFLVVVCVLSNKFANFWFITLTFRELNKLVSVLSKYSHEVPVTRFILQSHWLMQPVRQLRRSPVVNLMPLACWFTG